MVRLSQAQIALQEKSRELAQQVMAASIAQPFRLLWRAVHRKLARSNE